MLVLVFPRVSSRVTGFPVASPCLWGKLENISFSKVSKQVVMSFCVAGVAPCDIPTCLIMCRKCQIGGSFAQNARITASMRLVSSRWFSCGVAMSNGGSWKTCPFRMCPSRLSCRFAWQAWRFVTFQTCLIMFWKCQNWRKSRTKCCFFCIHVSYLESLVFLWRRRVHVGSSALHTLHFTLRTPQFTL